MKYVKKKLSELKPYENNPRINDEAVDDVAESIKRIM
jgi:ParB-like chromosome segregation protein Spo0J